MSLHISRIDPLLNAFMPEARFVGNTPQDHADLLIRYGRNLERRFRLAIEATEDQAESKTPKRRQRQSLDARDRAIYKTRLSGMTWSSVARTFNLSVSRCQQIFKSQAAQDAQERDNSASDMSECS